MSFDVGRFVEGLPDCLGTNGRFLITVRRMGTKIAETASGELRKVENPHVWSLDFVLLAPEPLIRGCVFKSVSVGMREGKLRFSILALIPTELYDAVRASLHLEFVHRVGWIAPTLFPFFPFSEDAVEQVICIEWMTPVHDTLPMHDHLTRCLSMFLDDALSGLAEFMYQSRKT